jgi:hypothetical protein
VSLFGGNPYAPTEGEARAMVRLGVERLAKMLAKAEREVAKRSDAAFRAGQEVSPRRRAALRARLTTACENRDRLQMAVRFAREEVTA